MKIIRKIFKAVLLLVTILAAGFAGIIIYALISDYKPPEKSIIAESQSTAALTDSVELTLLTWNIGYCGLDRDMDFFYDGGTKVFTPRPKCIENLEAVRKFLKSREDADYIFIQEIDKKSRRSYLINEFDSIAGDLSLFKSFFAKNYDVFFVPVPPASPMGKVVSGLATFSKNTPSSSVRYSFPGEYGFPKQLFMLDRCFLVNRYPLSNGRELLIINTHNEAFDNGSIRRTQMAYLKKFIEDEYGKGNFIITGGDWNQTPPGFRTSFESNIADTTNMAIPKEFMPEGWTWVYDNSNPSERNVIAGYDKAKTPTTILDFFLLSPNIEALSVKCINLEFNNSDHNPVIMKVRLKTAA
jgi:endonuclease/exonuclease/phosphatase family metal-dependent hydrolase